VPLSVLRATHLDDAPPIIGAGVRSRRYARLRLAPEINAGRPSVLLSRCYVTASALARFHQAAHQLGAMWADFKLACTLRRLA
jgi:hypothetical protein